MRQTQRPRLSLTRKQTCHFLDQILRKSDWSDSRATGLIQRPTVIRLIRIPIWATISQLDLQGTATRNLTQDYNYYLFASGKLGLGVNAFNPVARSLGFYDNQGRGNFNALLTELRHRFGNTFQFTTQYRWSKSMDTGSNNYYGGNYQFTQDREYGPSDYDTTHAFKAFGIWSPIIFRGNQGWLEKIVGG